MINLLETCLYNNTEELTYSDIFLYNYLDRDIYNSFLEKFIKNILKNSNITCNNGINDYTFLTQKIYSIFPNNTFELCKKIIDQLFNFDNMEDKEKKIFWKIFVRTPENYHLYSNLIKQCDEEIFVDHLSLVMCKKIINKTINIEIEGKLISFLKDKLIDYHYKLKIIFDDYVKSNIFSKNLNFSNIIIGRYSIWPLKINDGNIPKSFENQYSQIKNIYSEKTQGTNRKLYICNSLFRCDIEFNGYILDVKGKYVDFLLLFNKKDKILKTSIKENVNKFIKLKIIREDKDHYFVNDKFSFKKKKIKIN